MSFPKIILTGSVLVFVAIGITAVVKKKRQRAESVATSVQIEVNRGQSKDTGFQKVQVLQPGEKKPQPIELASTQKPAKETTKNKREKGSSKTDQKIQKAEAVLVSSSAPAPVSMSPIVSIGSEKKEDFPQIDRIYQLFTTGPTKLPIVETISYSSSVPWLKGRPAWVADYASHYGTSRHFIARSLNGKPDYFSQKVSTGSRFNVFRKDKHINFYLLIDISRCKMGFYYVDLDTDERVLLKTYRVGLGRLDPGKSSGSLTPLGKYSLGNKVAVYKSGTTGFFHDQKVEMIRVFGTRWIPFGEELDQCTAPAKGFGIHGAPWVEDPLKPQLIENQACIGVYDSDGGIQMAMEDIEEIYSIVITKPTVIEIVKDFHDAKLPGVEVATPRR